MRDDTPPTPLIRGEVGQEGNTPRPMFCLGAQALGRGKVGRKYLLAKDGCQNIPSKKRGLRGV